jgi:hypothetical protein
MRPEWGNYGAVFAARTFQPGAGRQLIRRRLLSTPVEVIRALPIEVVQPRDCRHSRQNVFCLVPGTYLTVRLISVF